ncbi:MAG: ABC transporter permease [Silvanigrellaceae bacterium]
MSHWFWPALQREIRTSWKKLSLAALSLCIGMSALTSLMLADARLELQTRRQADNILGGDAEISDVRLLPESLIESLNSSPKIARRSRVTSLVSMTTIASVARPRLVEILAVDDAFPLVPGMRFKPQFSFESLRNGGVLVESGFAVSNGLQVTSQKILGDASDKNSQKLFAERKAVRIGKRFFPIVGLVENDQMRDFASFSLGSRLYMARDVAVRQKLVSGQSRLRDKLLLQFPPQASLEASNEWLRGELKKIEPVRPNLRGKQDALNSAFKPARSLMLFFNAISFAALLLLGLGSAQGLHSYLQRKQYDARILSNLGAGRTLLAILYVGNVIIVSGVALAVGAWLGQFIFQHELAPRLGRWFSSGGNDFSLLSHAGLTTKFTFAAFLLTLSLILPGALLYLRRGQRQSFIAALSTSNDPMPKKILLGLIAGLENFPDLVWLITALLLSFLISSETAFNLILVITLTGLYLTVRFLVRLISRLGLSPGIRLPLFLRLAGSEIAARPAQSTLTLMLFGMSVCMLLFMWDLRTNIVNQISAATSGNQRPNVFVIDAPPESFNSVREILSRGGPQGSVLSERLTRARLARINNKTNEEWLDQFSGNPETRKTAERLLNREQNLTSRERLDEKEQSETIVEGQFWRPDSGKSALNEVSVEAGIAKNLNINLGDNLTFDIQGVPIKVKVTSVRRVRWQNFRPNFFFVLHPSVLADAPFRGIFAATLPDSKTRSEVLNNLSQNHPGITALDATELAELAAQLLTAALEIVGFLSLLMFAGALLNTFLSAWTSFTMRAQNFSLYRCLGANNSLVLRAVFGEFSLLSILGCLTGVATSWVLSSLVQKTLLTVDDQLQLRVMPGITITAVVVGLCCITALVSAILILRQAPFRVLRRPG